MKALRLHRFGEPPTLDDVPLRSPGPEEVVLDVLAMAEGLVVAASRLVDSSGLDPVAAASLTDAGLTSLHAVERSRERLGDGRVAVVVGVGGLGHMAVQILRALTACRVVAVDTQAAALELAERSGAEVAAYAGADAARASLPFWGTQPELVEVVRLARSGRLHVETTTFALTNAGEALALLRDGKVRGRAVLVPG
jgi:propanol-preferring alcohol dehydrogenase